MYFVLIGTRRRTKSAAAKGIRDLYAIPHREAEDDGRTLLHVGESTPVCADCDRGHLQWAEAGYGPWHRICDQCGSHWDLHPIVWGAGRAGTNLVETPVPPASRKCLMALAEEIGYPEDLQSASDAALRTYLQDYLENSPATMQQRASDPNMLVRWVDGRGLIPLDPAERIADDCPYTWGDMVRLITPELWAWASTPQRVKQMGGLIVVSGAWARRAHFRRGM